MLAQDKSLFFFCSTWMSSKGSVVQFFKLLLMFIWIWITWNVSGVVLKYTKQNLKESIVFKNIFLYVNGKERLLFATL